MIIKNIKYTLCFLLIGTSTILLTYQVNSFNFKILTINIGFCFFQIAYIYGTNNFNFSKKNKIGKLPLSTFILYWPFLFLSKFSYLISCLFYKVDLYSKLDTNIFIGRIPFYIEIKNINKLKISLVIDFATEFSEKIPMNTNTKYISLPTLDGCPISFEDSIKGMNAIKESYGNIYIHCALGHGRSVMFTAFYFAINYNLSGAEALQQIYAVRPTAKLNNLQQIQLENYINLAKKLN